MLSYTLFALLSSWTMVHCQMWVGNFTTDNLCDQQSCCCIGPDLQLTQSGSSLAFRVALRGQQCFGQTSYSNQGDYPTGYTSTISISGLTITLTLSSDSNNLTIVSSMGASCTSMATRNGGSQVAVVTTTMNTNTNTTMGSGAIPIELNLFLILFFLVLF